MTDDCVWFRDDSRELELRHACAGWIGLDRRVDFLQPQKKPVGYALAPNLVDPQFPQAWAPSQHMNRVMGHDTKPATEKLVKMEA